jgi:hypothetical protein
MGLLDIDHQQMEVNNLNHNITCFFSFTDLIGKIEQATDIDINGDGYINGRSGQYRLY